MNPFDFALLRARALTNAADMVGRAMAQAFTRGRRNLPHRNPDNAAGLAMTSEPQTMSTAASHRDGKGTGK